MSSEMSALNQNKRLSRLAIISLHVAADKRKRFGTVWVNLFAKENFLSPLLSVFSYLFIPSECSVLVCSFSAGMFTLRVSNIVLMFLGVSFLC